MASFRKENSFEADLTKAIAKTAINGVCKELTKSRGIAAYPPKKTIVSFAKKAIEESIK